ncbi:MAG TPA: hypothetical protein VGB84_04415 [Arachidicoccus sp.]
MDDSKFSTALFIHLGILGIVNFYAKETQNSKVSDSHFVGMIG